MDPATLQYFDQEDSDLLLYALRYLELAVRPAAATYVAKQELNAQACMSAGLHDHSPWLLAPWMVPWASARFLPLAVPGDCTAAVIQRTRRLQECDVLSRAIRDHMRRDGKKEGFSLTPGDCLAYKYFRDVRALP